MKTEIVELKAIRVVVCLDPDDGTLIVIHNHEAGSFTRDQANGLFDKLDEWYAEANA